MPRHIIQHTFNPAGIDLRNSDITRNPNSTTGGNNYIRNDSGALVKRPGYSIKDYNIAGFGLALYQRKVIQETDADGWGDFAWGVSEWGSPTIQSTGQIVEDLIALADLPKKWTNATLTVTYTGANVTTIAAYVDSTSKMRIKIVENGSEILDFDCGTGKEGSPTTIATLVTAITALSNFSATVTGTTSTSAAHLNITPETVIATGGGSVEIDFGYLVDLNAPSAQPLTNIENRESRTDYENPSTVSFNGVLYVSNGRDELHKYDGQNFYRAGMPLPTTITAVNNAAAGNLSGNYIWICTYEQEDAVGNVTEGAKAANSNTLVVPASEKADLTVTNILANTGFNTNCAVVDGNQSSSNLGTNQEELTVDDGSGGAHTLKAGDTAYFYDTSSSSYLELEVLSVTSSTVVLNSPATVQVLDNQIISNNLKINIWRTVAGGTSIFYLVESIPNDSYNTTQTYTDNIADGSLGAEYIEPIKTPGLPPKGKYLTIWNNQLIIAGNLDNPNRIFYSYFSDIVSPEIFPAENYIEVGRGVGGVITGLGAVNRNLMVFNKDTTFLAEGNLAIDIIRFDPISLEIGCSSHHTIKNLDNTILWLSSDGVYSFNGKTLTRLSKALDPIFNSLHPTDYKTSINKATAEVIKDRQRYFLFLPVEDNIGNNPYATTSSQVYIWDNNLKEWFPWNNINALGGITSWNDGTVGETLWFSSREQNDHNLFRFNVSNSEYDFVDHVSAISLEYPTQWFHGGMPGTDKQFINLNMFSLYESADLNYTPSGTMTIEIEKNFNRDTAESTLTAAINQTNPYVTKSIRSTKKRSIRLVFKNNELNKQVILTGWALSYFPYRSELKR
jgi:hypothetical protein